MLSAETLVARTVAIHVSRGHNANIYALRGCEDLDSRYRSLVKLLAKFHIAPFSQTEPERLYQDVFAKIETNPAFGTRLDALFKAGFATEFGRLVAYVVSKWEELPETPRNLAAPGVEWIHAATASWSADFRAKMSSELLLTARGLYLFTNVWLLRRMTRLLDRKHTESRLEDARNDFPGMAFSAVLDEEMEEIEKRRGVAPTTATAARPQQRADQANLTGLAFSGGGIRSATFNLGVLQSLAEERLLGRFDYLSTVSGGGYIGSWLHAWIHDADKPRPGQSGHATRGIDYVQESLSPSNVPDPQDARSGPIRFLRRYSNYLTPKTGLFSADTWTMLNIWLRNTFLNILILMLALSAILLAPRWLAAAADGLDSRHITDLWWALMILPGCFIGLNLAAFESKLKRRWVPAWLHTEQAILLLIVAPIFVAAWAAGTEVPNDLLDLAQNDKDVVGRACWEFAGVTAMLVLLASAIGRLDLSFYPDCQPRHRWFYFILTVLSIFGICLIAALPTAGLDWMWNHFVAIPHYGTNVHPGSTTRMNEATIMRILTTSAPVFLFLLSTAVFLYVGLLGRRFPDDRREWMARMGGWFAIACIGWAALCGTATYGPEVVAWLVKDSKKATVAETGGLSAGWILITAAGAFWAANNKPGGSLAGLKSVVTRLAPPVFVGGLLLLLSYALDGLYRDGRVLGTQNPYWGWLSFFLSAACGGLALFLSSRVDINEFSLHMFYRNRLVRCYLGGARAGSRQPECFTGFDARDDFPVHALAPSTGYSGPYPIFNVTLNVVHGDELAWQERKGEAFVFTPKFSGFDVAHGRATHPRMEGQSKLSYGGYRPTRNYASARDRGISVGTAVTISGAAASPNQGSQTSASTAFLMTVLDVRLGWWLGNPRRTDTWRKPGPTEGLFQLLAELTGSTNDTGKYVNLSDGGHFENLAIYELVRRRCRRIVACDSEEDHDYTFGGLGNVIRKCRTDFGVEIEIDMSGLKPANGGPFTRDHCALGKITYPQDANGPRTEGSLVYIKSSLTGNESADVLQFAMGNPRFPHESTANQWFDETRFESYRKLGYLAAQSARALIGDLGEPPGSPVLKGVAATA